MRKLNNGPKTPEAIRASHEKHTDPYKYVECSFCTFRAKELSNHVIIHDITRDEYKINHGPLKSQEMCDRVKGSNNPAYQHGGKFSPFSYKFVKGTDKVQETKRKAAQSRVDNESNTASLGYWLKLTNGDEATAKKLQAERQATFSIEKCIAKYGEDEGKQRWLDRQEKWQSTLNSKSDEEKAEINKKKIYKNGMSSKIEKELYKELTNNSELQLEQQLTIRRKDSNRYYAYDITYQNKIIEFNGDLWHANPAKFSEDDVPRFPSNTKTAKEIWNKDELKKQTAIDHGYELFVVWETDFRTNKQKVIQDCINFLTT